MLNYIFNWTFHKPGTTCEQECCMPEKYFANFLNNEQVLKQHYSGVSWRTWESKLLVCRLFLHKLKILVFSHFWFQLLNNWLNSVVWLSSKLQKANICCFEHFLLVFIFRDYTKFSITKVVITLKLQQEHFKKIDHFKMLGVSVLQIHCYIPCWQHTEQF